MKTNQWLGLLAAAVLPLLTNGCAHAQTPPPSPPPVATGPAPVVEPAPAPAPATTPAPAVSPAAAEVVRLAEAGTSEDVILAYIQNDTAPFDLSADQILYLRDVGVSSPVITAMLSRDTTLKGQGAAAPAPMPAQAPPPAAVEAPLVPQTPVEYVSSPPPEVGYFYDDLSPYGTWVQLDGVGWCWQPRVVVINHGWRPYCDSGHWVYTDAGWFWQSDYSWGWAPFHYGRWQLSERCGWVWLPDRVWGPAWVTWRYEGDHCGWAPLPPHAEFDVHMGYRFNGVHVAATFDFGLRPDHFTFIAVRDFHDHDFAHHRLPPAEVTRIYNHTTVINNYEIHNNIVVNQGIKVDRVAAATHTEIRKVAIRDVPSRSAAVAASHGGARAELAVYRPELRTPPHPVNAVAQKVDARHPAIQHTPTVLPASNRPMVATTQNAGTRGTPGTSAYPGRGQQERSGSTSTRPSNIPATQPQNQKSNRPLSTSPEQSRPGTSTARPAAETPSRPPVANNQSQANRPNYPLRSTQGNANPQGQNQQTYYPKGYYQSGAEGRGNGQQYNNRPAESRGQNYNSRPDNGDRGHGNGRRNDQ